MRTADTIKITPLRDGGEISPEVMRRIERDLDLQESRLGGWAQAAAQRWGRGWGTPKAG